MANDPKPNTPARRLKQAQLILRMMLLTELQAQILSIGFKIHAQHIDRLENALLSHEELIKTVGLARSLMPTTIPQDQRDITDRQLTLTFNEMRQSSQRQLTAFNTMT